MLYLYNTTTEVYKDLYRKAFESLDEYLTPTVEDTTIYDIMFVMSLNDIFEQAKRRTAMRGRFARDAQGGSLVEGFALTDDEKDWFDQIMPNGSAEVFRKLSAWAKTVFNAHRYGVSFGLKAVTGTVTSVAGTVITDSSLALTANQLAGYRLVITSEGDLKDQERDISGNTEGTIILSLPFDDDITDLEYAVYNPTELFTIYSVKMDLTWELNMLMEAESAIKEALVLYAMKEWYLLNRYMDDFTIEDTRYQEELQKIRSALMQRSTILRRPADLFG